MADIPPPLTHEELLYCVMDTLSKPDLENLFKAFTEELELRKYHDERVKKMKQDLEKEKNRLINRFKMDLEKEKQMAILDIHSESEEDSEDEIIPSKIQQKKTKKLVTKAKPAQIKK